jgi:hypothetical protein
MTATMSLDVIAYHEAGHAAAGIILGIGLISHLSKLGF